MNFLIIEYFPILVLLGVAIGLSLIIFGASFFLSIQKSDVEKISAYECGFDPYEDSRNKFEIRFYLVAILFLIFDLETIFCFYG
jgi:NADH-quinone oxidoreductase subunit A